LLGLLSSKIKNVFVQFNSAFRYTGLNGSLFFIKVQAITSSFANVPWVLRDKDLVQRVEVMEQYFISPFQNLSDLIRLQAFQLFDLRISALE